MPRLRPSRPSRPRRRRTSAVARIVVLGDLMLDVVLAPARPLEDGSDVPGRVTLVQGGSAANTARWLGRLGARTMFIGAVGRDAAGRALVDALRSDRVVPRVARMAGTRTGRIGVLVAPDGERSFVADRAAADRLGPDDLQDRWFDGVQGLHLPVYSLLGESLGAAARRAIEMARARGALVSIDLASIVPLLAQGRLAARSMLDTATPDLLFATASEAEALVGRSVEALLEIAPMAVVKRGAKGATVLLREGDARLRFEIATEHVVARDTTGAGDAFDAGFLVGWFAARAAGRGVGASLQRAALVGHRTAARQLSTPRPELPLA